MPVDYIHGGPKPPKKAGLVFRLLAFLLTLVLVLAAVAAVAYWDRFNFDAVRRFFTYRSLERNESGQAESISYDSSSNNSFATLDGGLLISSPTSIRLYSAAGNLHIDKTVNLTHPVVETVQNAALVYDVGGQDLYVLSQQETAFALSLEENRALLSASLNDAGWLAVTAQESGYKGAVTIYNAAYEKTLQINLSSSFVTDAVISPDCKWVAVVTVGLGTSGFESQVNLYKLDRSAEDIDPDLTCSLGNNISLDLLWKDDGIWSLGENGLAHVAADGTPVGSYSYTGRYLKNFSLGGEGFAALLLGKYRAGSTADLSVVDGTGQVLATVSTTDQILSLSAAGKYIGVLTADRLDIYTQDLTLYNTLSVTQGAQQVIMHTDGSAMLVGATTARLYVPK